MAAAHVAAPHRFRSYYPQEWMDHLSDGAVTHTLAAFPASGAGGEGGGGGYGRSTHAASLAAGGVRVEAAAAFRHVSLDLAAFVLDAAQVDALTRSVAVLPLGVAASGDRVVAVGGAMADPADAPAVDDGTTDGGNGDGDGGGGDGGIPPQLPRAVAGVVARVHPGRSLVRTAAGMTVLGMCGGPVLAAGGGVGGGKGGEASGGGGDGGVGGGGGWPPPCVGLLEALVPPGGGPWQGHSVVVPAVEIAAFLEDVAAEVAGGAA